MKKVLLLEPNYNNKYPPMGLMKIATYYRERKYRRNTYDVRFFKGDLSSFAADLLCEEILSRKKNTNRLLWAKHFSKLTEYIKTGRYASLKLIPDFNEFNSLSGLRNRYINKDFPQFDIICITTLFTFYWKKTIDTINFAKHFCKKGEIKVGGIAATILPQYIKEETKIDPYIGLWDVVDNLPLDYSILEEIDYKYPANNAYFAYTTRGCVNKCAFCAVPKLEYEYCNYIPLKETLDKASIKFGKKRNLLLMDDNVFASNKFDEIIDEIKKCGFEKNTKYKSINEYNIAIKNLRNNWNNRAYIKKILKIYEQISEKLNEQEQGNFYLQRKKLNLLYEQTATKSSILKFHKIVNPIYKNQFKQSNITRYVDFNQGLDARLATEEKIKKIAEINIRPLRIAFDHWGQKNIYEKAIHLAKKYEINNLSNYLLYNFNDKPEDLYNRMELNIKLCEDLKITIYSFPMKYHPIENPKYFHNRDFIGKHWCKKYIRAVQAVLNSTKGKIGRGESFFRRAFGENLAKFKKILEMPETFILYRSFFEWLETKEYKISTKKWEIEFDSLEGDDKIEALDIIHKANFNDLKINNPRIVKLIRYYTNYKDEVITPGTELYELKQEFNSLDKKINSINFISEVKSFKLTHK
ncbi:MAG: hypothetical protein LBC87_09625 [Fibromonadaceae bacterium]|jgi:hypothetical protein|nr:hypothetical protein [Fibromonadaceae bacterium]